MTLQATRRQILDFEALVEEPGELRWAVARNPQPTGKEWCWAASLANVLAAYGRESDPADLVRRFRSRHPDVVSDDGQNLPRRAWLAFYRQWFPDASFRHPMMPRELKALLFRSPLVGVLKNTVGDHLILVSGFRLKDGFAEVEVSDSLWPARSWIPWDELRQGHPAGAPGDPAYWGPWKESILLGRPGFPEYVFRFVAEVGRLQMDPVPPIPGWQADVDHPSHLEFADPPVRPLRLREELSLSLLGYLLKYEGKHPKDIKEQTYLHESMPLRAWSKRRVHQDRPLARQLFALGWHHQLASEEGEPRQYAQTRRIDDDWRTRWIGRRWLTTAIDRALRSLDRNVSEESGTVEMIWLSFGFSRHVHLLRWIDRNLYLVASVSWPGGREIWPIEDGFRLLEESEVLGYMSRSL